jgi:hypothetical protein
VKLVGSIFGSLSPALRPAVSRSVRELTDGGDAPIVFGGVPRRTAFIGRSISSGHYRQCQRAILEQDDLGLGRGMHERQKLPGVQRFARGLLRLYLTENLACFGGESRIRRAVR